MNSFITLDPLNQVERTTRKTTTMTDHVQFAPVSNASANPAELHLSHPELPLTVKDAARFLGVSSQTVYLWVERRQIPHLRIMGRNIRFLRSDLATFRDRFKQEVENGTAK